MLLHPRPTFWVKACNAGLGRTNTQRRHLRQSFSVGRDYATSNRDVHDVVERDMRQAAGPRTGTDGLLNSLQDDGEYDPGFTQASMTTVREYPSPKGISHDWSADASRQENRAKDKHADCADRHGDLRLSGSSEAKSGRHHHASIPTQRPERHSSATSQVP